MGKSDVKSVRIVGFGEPLSQFERLKIIGLGGFVISAISFPFLFPLSLIVSPLILIPSVGLLVYVGYQQKVKDGPKWFKVLFFSSLSVLILLGMIVSFYILNLTFENMSKL